MAHEVAAFTFYALAAIFILLMVLRAVQLSEKERIAVLSAAAGLLICGYFATDHNVDLIRMVGAGVIMCTSAYANLGLYYKPPRAER